MTIHTRPCELTGPGCSSPGLASSLLAVLEVAFLVAVLVLVGVRIFRLASAKKTARDLGAKK